MVLSHNIKKVLAWVAVPVAVLVFFVCGFMITRGENPHTSELSFIEHSVAGIGSVIPASCESGYAHSYLCTPPTIVDVTISTGTPVTAVTANGSDQYTIRLRASDVNGGGAITEGYSMVNYQGVNAGTYRGYLGWSLASSFPWWGGSFKNPPIACTGGGFGAIHGSAYGPSFINLISCTTSVAGNVRTITYRVSFNTNFSTPDVNNTISGFAYDNNNGMSSGWVPDDIFSLAPDACSLPWGGTIASGNSVTAYQSASVVSPATCVSQTRTCTDGTLSGTYTNQTCTVAVNGSCAANFNSCTVGTLNDTADTGTHYQWSCNGSNGGSNASCSRIKPTGNISVSPSGVIMNETSRVSWSSSNASDCTAYSVEATNGDSWTGTSNVAGVSTTPLTSNTNYRLICYVPGDSTGLVVDQKLVTVVSSPTLTTNRYIVEEGGSVSLTYNTSGQTCTLTGQGSVSGNATVAIPEVTAQTTFTLSCPIGSASVTVEIIPIGFET